MLFVSAKFFSKPWRLVSQNMFYEVCYLKKKKKKDSNFIDLGNYGLKEAKHFFLGDF